MSFKDVYRNIYSSDGPLAWQSESKKDQAPHLTQDTNWKVTTSQLDITNESQEVSPFPGGDRNASLNTRAQKHNKNKTGIP